jgi:excinuclease UvrABC helicase subunit UvrB
VRFKVPLYVLDTVLSEGGIEVDDNEEIKPERGVKPSSSGSPSTGSGSHKKLEDTPLDKLNEMLDKALELEEYEKAAKIRDEINRRN